MDVADATGVQHQVVVGDVRLSRRNAFGRDLTVCAVRRRAARTPAQVARLCEDLVAASQLLRREHGRPRVEFQDNYVSKANYAGPALAEAVLA